MTIFKSKDDNCLYTISVSVGHYHGQLNVEPYNHTRNYKKSSGRRLVHLNNFDAVGTR